MNPLHMLAVGIESEDNSCYTRVYTSFVGKETNALTLWGSEYIFLHLQSGDAYLLAKTSFYREHFKNSLSVLHSGRRMPFYFPSLFLKMSCIFIIILLKVISWGEIWNRKVLIGGYYQSAHWTLLIWRALMTSTGPLMAEN